MTLIKMISSYDSLLATQLSHFDPKLPIPRMFKSINSLSFVRDAVTQLKFEMGGVKFPVEIFMLEDSLKVPTDLLVQDDVFYVILYSLLIQASKSSKSQSLAVYISWEPPQVDSNNEDFKQQDHDNRGDNIHNQE